VRHEPASSSISSKVGSAADTLLFPPQALIGSLIGVHAPCHHGYQRACCLGSPVFACAGTTVLPFRLSLADLGRKVLRCLESSTTSQHGPGDACELVGERDSEHVAVQPLLGRLDPAPKPMTLPQARRHLGQPVFRPGFATTFDAVRLVGAASIQSNDMK
jgi:hypothetical protein